jgi:hypothetical protein
MSLIEPGTTPPMVVLRPGDRVLVTLAGESDPEEIQETTAILRDAFPGVEFVVMDGVAGILVGGS